MDNFQRSLASPNMKLECRFKFTESLRHAVNNFKYICDVNELN